MNVIAATEKHFPAIQSIAHETWPVTFGEILTPAQIAYMLEWMYSIPSLTEQVQQKGHTFLLVQHDGVFKGYASYELNYKDTAKTKIHKIYILPTAQGTGVGKALMNEIQTIAKQNGNTHLLLNVNRNNKAVQFYERLGYKVMGEENIDIGNGFLMEDYTMEKVIGNFSA